MYLRYSVKLIIGILYAVAVTIYRRIQLAVVIVIEVFYKRTVADQSLFAVAVDIVGEAVGVV